MTVLTIDVGNTSAKVAVMQDGEIKHLERRNEPWAQLLQRLAGKYGAERVLLSTVGKEDTERDEALAALQLPVSKINWDTPEAEKWLKNIPEGLGADRLAADIGARALAPGCPLLIVDAGTCLTFDVIGKDGTILGGSISPGVELRLKAMHEHTALLPLVSPEGDAPAIGNDTERCMRGGAVNGVRWEIEGYVRMLLEQMGSDLHVFSTGGNLFHFAPEIEAHITTETSLIHIGLWHTFVPEH